MIDEWPKPVAPRGSPVSSTRCATRSTRPSSRRAPAPALVALGVTVVLGLVWWRLRPGAAPLPIAGLAATAAAAYALRETRLAAGPCGARADFAGTGRSRGRRVATVDGVPVRGGDSGRARARLRPLRPSICGWVRLVVFATTVVGGVALASFDRRWARHGLGAPLVALWAAGRLHDAARYRDRPRRARRHARRGRRRVARCGSAASAPAGRCRWPGSWPGPARFSGTGRPSSIVGAVACIGLARDRARNAAVAPLRRRPDRRVRATGAWPLVDACRQWCRSNSCWFSWPLGSPGWVTGSTVRCRDRRRRGRSSRWPCAPRYRDICEEGRRTTAGVGGPGSRVMVC